MRTLIVASNNAHKIEEIKAIMANLDFEVLSLREAGIESDPEETGTTFAENALIKARALSELTNAACLADDSGLVVDALHGAPGVLSARFAGVHGNDAANNAKLLELMQEVSEEERTAAFVCTLAFIGEDGSELVVEGCCPGRIGYEESGSGGFGYDPLFLPEHYGFTKSMADLRAEEKNAISHRGAALAELERVLQSC